MFRYQKHSPLDRAAQGDIYRIIRTPISAKPLIGEELEISEIEYPYAVTLSQECDLSEDCRNRENIQDKHDKYLPSILFAPAYFSESLRKGSHLAEVGYKMEPINSNNWHIIKQNNNPRYHFLHQDLEFGIPELTIDFKHYFTIPRELFYLTILDDDHYVASLNILFREDLSNRFSYYLSRIGLPLVEQPAENLVTILEKS